ncbi:flagellar hook-associated protein FlgL [compost metagenome]
MGVEAPINITGNEAFGTGSSSLFSIVKGLKDAFSSGDQTTATQLFDDLKTGMENFSQVRSEVGARSNRITLMENRLSDLALSLEGLTSKVEDADVAEVITKLQTDQSVYQASLSTGAKIIQRTLVDYLG